MTVNEDRVQELQSNRPNIFPEIVYRDAPAALEWLAQAFGFTLGDVIKGPNGTIAHAEMHHGAGTIMPQSPLEESEFGMSPQALGGVTQRLYVAVEDPDAHCERAKAGGAQIVWDQQTPTMARACTPPETWKATSGASAPTGQPWPPRQTRNERRLQPTSRKPILQRGSPGPEQHLAARPDSDRLVGEVGG